MLIIRPSTARKGLVMKSGSGHRPKPTITAASRLDVPQTQKTAPTLGEIMKTTGGPQRPAAQVKKPVSFEQMVSNVTATIKTIEAASKSKPAPTAAKSMEAAQIATMKAERVADQVRIAKLEQQVATLTEALANQDAKKHEAEISQMFARRAFGCFSR